MYEDNEDLVQFRNNWRRELIERGIQNINSDIISDINSSKIDLDVNLSGVGKFN